LIITSQIKNVFLQYEEPMERKAVSRGLMCARTGLAF